MKRLICLILSMAAVLFWGEKEACAKNTAYTDEGNIIFETTDTKAISDVRWTEVGFTIRRDRTGGNPIKDKNYGVLWLKPEYRTKKDNGDGSYFVRFTIPKKDIEKELANAGILMGKGNTLYLNGIFQVIRYGKPDKDITGL